MDGETHPVLEEGFGLIEPLALSGRDHFRKYLHRMEKCDSLCCGDADQGDAYSLNAPGGSRGGDI